MYIKAQDVCVTFPVFDAHQRSFKKTLFKAAAGGGLSSFQKGFAEIEALKHISLNIQEGERVALIGHNGSGKTTLLRVFAGVYAPSRGKVEVQGGVTSLLDAMLGMDGEATGFENIRMRSLFLGLSPKQIDSITDEVVEFSELGDFINMPVRTYSSGMVLRLAFSISTSVQPEIILMDEWMSVGDESFRQKAEARLMRFINHAGILVFATHDFDLAKRLCNRMIFLEHGVMVREEVFPVSEGQ
ncbi:MAG: ABC transporter ATP-binding protein [Cardiobacteriaceae bacterium]|nr:ABC transporter ATP-binding protein [Cardiobacteriaceae bacterium]